MDSAEKSTSTHKYLRAIEYSIFDKERAGRNQSQPEKMPKRRRETNEGMAEQEKERKTGTVGMKRRE